MSLSALWEAYENTSPYGSLASKISMYLRSNGVDVFYEVHYDSMLKAADNDRALDLLGAFCFIVKDSPAYTRSYPNLERQVNNVLEDHRVAFRLVDAEVVPIESDELHNEVVIPTLRLLVGGRFTKAHTAYLEALKQLPSNPPNAITDAGTALQETLAALDCTGNSLGPLIKSARSRGLLAPHDAKLADGIEKFLQWASANRSEIGDGHNVSDASREDAWLMVHIVGALILKLVRMSAAG